MTPLEALVLGYVQNHPMTRRSTVVEVLGDRDWQRQKRVREALDTLSALQYVQKIGTGKRNLRYQLKETQQ